MPHSQELSNNPLLKLWKCQKSKSDTLKSVNRKNELIIWEKIVIHKNAYHIMNFEVPLVSSLIKKYICRPADSASMAPISIATMQGATLQSI